MYLYSIPQSRLLFLRYQLFHQGTVKDWKLAETQNRSEMHAVISVHTALKLPTPALLYSCKTGQH